MDEVSIIGCGETASQWDGKGFSIGVNDCWRFGKPTDYLVVVNTKKQFTEERLNWIIRSQPERLYTHSEDYRHDFPESIFFKLKEDCFQKWRGKLIDSTVQFSKTSPFVAISLAYSIGAKTINLYGVDFNNHKTYNPSNTSDFLHEINNYKSLFQQLKAKGITINCTKESYLNNVL